MVSNKTLSIVLVATMFVAVFGAIMSLNRIDGISDFYVLTGAWDGSDQNSTYGSVNLTITSMLSINFSKDVSDFGSGYVKAGQSACVLSTGLTAEDTAGCSDFTAPGLVQGLLLENIGNEYAIINISNTNYSSEMLGVSGSGYAWQWSPEDNDTCFKVGNHADLPDNDTLQNLTSDNYPGESGNAGKQICSIFNYSSNSNAINITFKMHIPQNAPARKLSDTWFAFATLYA